jgi:deoxyribodipyrimidine photo-lyase
MPPIPPERLSAANDLPVRDQGFFVLYWMRAARRPLWNFSLQHAANRAAELRRPLLIVETLACDEPYANLRHHHFALDGMADNARALEKRPARYFPFVEDQPGQIPALLAALGREACLVVTDDHPLLWMRQSLRKLAEQFPVRLETVDGNGLLPLRTADSEFATAYAFRRFLQRSLPGHLLTPPEADPLAGTDLPQLKSLPGEITRKWPTAGPDLLGGSRTELRELPIDQQVERAPRTGGHRSAEQTLEHFLAEGLPEYAEHRNQPEREVTSGLSPYLRWGHVSSHLIVHRLLDRYDWTPGDLSPESRGRRSGWWGLDENAEAFLDQLITWRELGCNLCARRDDYERFVSLPAWAQKTLLDHADDPRPYLYSPENLAGAHTHDLLWNAAQRQLVREGRMHNYLRMLWGKKILQWSPSPQTALAVMIELNDRFALDGRDPNSYSGIGWCLGRFDRAWGPERPIFGKIRYMSSANTARKF